MNVLLTCAGRRTYLIRFFQEALAGRGEVIACDCSASAPAMTEADRHLVVPRTDSPEYLPALLALCQRHAVRLVIGVNDLELSDLARAAPQFHEIGTFPVVATPSVLATCQDKWETYLWLRSHNIPTPRTCLTLAETHQALAHGDLHFPLLIKPRRGTSSFGIEYAERGDELELACEWVQLQARRSPLGGKVRTSPGHDFVIQEKLPGQEYGLDVVNDLNSRYVCTLSRRKLAMRAGNTDRAETVSDPALDRLGRILGCQLKHPGNLDCDVVVTDTGYSVLDLNPRFGGGYPFSHLAGANIPAALLAWASGEEPDPSWLRTKPGIVVSKYDGLMVVSQ